MGQADLALKELTSRPQTAADVVNSLLCDGEEVVLAKDVTPVSEQTTVKKGDQLVGRIRDVFHQIMCWNGQIFNIVYVGFEHQTTVDRGMPLRSMGYNYGKYDDMWKDNPGKPLAPVITLVLYFGEEPWNGPTTLYDMLEKSALKRFKRWISNYKTNVIDMGRLSNRQIRKFRGVFRALAIAHTYACGRMLPIHKERIKHKAEIEPALKSLGMEISDELWESIPERIEYMTLFEKMREEDKQKAKVEVAEAMLADGIAPEKISVYTSLPLDQILSLQTSGGGA